MVRICVVFETLIPLFTNRFTLSKINLMESSHIQILHSPLCVHWFFHPNQTLRAFLSSQNWMFFALHFYWDLDSIPRNLAWKHISWSFGIWYHLWHAGNNLHRAVRKFTWINTLYTTNIIILAMKGWKSSHIFSLN